jgi:hypothetical protein
VTVHGYKGMMRNTVMSDVSVHGYIGMVRNTVMCLFMVI